MRNTPIINVVIPAFNEEKSIAKVIGDIDRNLVDEVIVVNNNSTDNTVQVAQEAGAVVLTEKRKGYGYACLLGIERTIANQADIVVFLDGDYSDYPQQIIEVVTPILENEMDMVIGSRALGNREKGSMTPQQVFGNWLATRLMKIFYGASFTDLGPFRAIKSTSLAKLKMADKTYGWTIEMQIKAAKHKMRFCEVPVKYRKRIGVSKVSGTVKGTIMAGIKIIGAVFKYKFTNK
ncbi:Glycosyltransferase involved in cell wall bisynthesis [Lishizhenia tianjinensis]|uniref:Glycosyltransferase involved in cell wall bisynthesis n=1 Tax=Lishizhenia tianjinensis TaxID=477690 RepID=A0A1I7AQY5_9FLAO|nr:glycosyltransferase family 2 protein [Lishizhenia tianjinensis]SFT77342.1 Glycosyltransferase involved in cell wall bisynthesis [Lishizhenia tianjinensis]